MQITVSPAFFDTTPQYEEIVCAALNVATDPTLPDGIIRVQEGKRTVEIDVRGDSVIIQEIES